MSNVPNIFRQKIDELSTPEVAGLARELHRAFYETGRQITPPFPVDAVEHIRWIMMARAALKFLRAPTKAMCEAYYGLDPCMPDEPSNPPAVEKALAAMIDTALEEKPS